VLHFHLDAVHERLTFKAIPFECIELVRSRRLDDEPDRAFLWPLRRVPHVRRQQENLALANRNIVEVAVIHQLEQHVAFELVEKFLHRVVMAVRSLGPPTTWTVISPSSNTFLFPTGGLSRCRCSSIHFWKLKAWSRRFSMGPLLLRSQDERRGLLFDETRDFIDDRFRRRVDFGDQCRKMLPVFRGEL